MRHGAIPAQSRRAAAVDRFKIMFGPKGSIRLKKAAIVRLKYGALGDPA